MRRVGSPQLVPPDFQSGIILKTPRDDSADPDERFIELHAAAQSWNDVLNDDEALPPTPRVSRPPPLPPSWTATRHLRVTVEERLALAVERTAAHRGCSRDDLIAAAIAYYLGI